MPLYSRNTLRTMVRDEINEPVARVFTDDQIDNFIDLGAMATAAITFGDKDSEDESLATDQYAYTLSKNFIFIESCTYSDGATPDVIQGLQRVHPEVFGGGTDYAANIPKLYTHFGSSVFVYPRPSSNENTKVITVRGYVTVAGFGGGSSETLDGDLQMLPYFYALSCAYAKLGKHRLSAFNMQQFIAECNQHRIDISGQFRRVDTWDTSKIPDVTVTPQ